MVLLEYLQRPSPLCYNNGSPQKQLPSSAPVRGFLCNADPGSARRKSLPGARWGILGPAARILKGSADLVNNTVLGRRDGLTEEERLARAKREERAQILGLRMKNAETMEQWKVAAKELDVLDDNEAWKADSTSADFDAGLIESRLKQLDEARINCDVKAMLHLVRTALARDLGGMGNIKLYKHSHIGTKDLIERYIDSTLDTIRSLVEKSKIALPDGLETKDILEEVVHARQAFGRSALLLSGGATFGMNHVGVLKALFEAKLLPRIISGASAGSIVCAVLCTRIDEEIPEVLKAFPHGDLAVFEEDGNEDGILERVRRLLTQGAWIDIKHLMRVMQELLGDLTFQEAYNRTRRILNICVSSASVYELPRLLNYVTSPNVMIWSAVAASCSVPVLFSAAQLLVKNPITGENSPWNPTPQKWIDGSVDNDLPMTRLAEMFNVNHFIVSQVNPHVVPFLVKDDISITKNANSEDDAGPGWVYTLTNLAKDEALHRMQVLAELGIFPNLVSKARSVLSQKYSGDITILPEIEYKDFPRMLKNPTAEFMVQACLCGERATWPKLSRIRNHCAIELELDAAVQKLRARVVFSPSQVDLRRMTTGSVRHSARHIGRKRGDSGSGAQALGMTNDDVEDEDAKTRTSMSRPPLRTASSHWSVTRRYLPPLTTPMPRTAHGTPLPTPFIFQPINKMLELRMPFPDISSAGETSHSPPSSDADIDSHTDESSPEPDVTDDTMPGFGLYFRIQNQNQNRSDRGDAADEVDFFSASQPITANTDHVLATSPLSSRANLMVSPLGVAKKGPERKAVPQPSSPELRYKRLFHGLLPKDEA
ncbi:probable TGL4 Triacylglycerol lipase involved in TAG mobilization [Rhynchosporium agropyri]|uniref:Patatin-like phospholipase domain-containing protein n=1 Tax=Rhynchosporium agropyri TaxID=914238 RepID=A0A1E1LK71_9HELO|nr:probable TGL4 Triacylglycerol lipase involved in TAG mobilization [Rhynchosporium agropyri]